MPNLELEPENVVRLGEDIKFRRKRKGDKIPKEKVIGEGVLAVVTKVRGDDMVKLEVGGLWESWADITRKDLQLHYGG